MRRLTIAMLAASALASGSVVVRADPVETLAARVDMLEKEVRALREENRALRARPVQTTRPPSAAPNPGPYAAAPPAARASAYAAAPAGGGSWTGSYVGANLGLSIGRSGAVHSDFFSVTPGDVRSDTFNLSPFGVIGGGQIGYNWQATPNWVLGIEADFQGSAQNDAACVFQCASVLGTGVTRNVTLTQHLDWFGTVRGRVGWTSGPALFYGTGGLAYGHLKSDVSFADFNFGTPIAAAAGVAQTKTGWVAGFGAEMQLFGNWTGRAEYLYVDLGSVGAASFTAVFTPTINEPHHVSSSFRDHIMRLGVNYQFDGPAYVSATSASGMSYKAAPLAAYTWSGFYAGVNVGLSVAHNPTTTSLTIINNTAGTVLPVPGGETSKLAPWGVIGGGQVGYNWQAAPHWVLGLEADFQGSSQEDSVCLSCVFINSGGASGQFGTALKQRVDWFGTVRGRVGWTDGPVLYYATGGLAYGHVVTDETVYTIPFLTGVTTAATFADTKLGWTAGGGIEAQLFGNWTAKAEYLYVDLGDVTGSVVAPQTVIPINVNPNNINESEVRGFRSTLRDHLFRLGANYRFAP